MSFDDLYRNIAQLLDSQSNDFSKTLRDHVQTKVDQQNLALDRLDAKLDQVIDLLTTPVELRVELDNGVTKFRSGTY